MTIKHAIPKIEWAIELLYYWVKTGSQLVGDQMSWWQDVVEKATTQQNRPGERPIEFWRPDQLVRRCWNENMSQRGWAPRHRLSSPGEREWHTAMSGGAGEVNMLQFCSVSNSLSHTIFQIKWEVYLFKKSSSSLLLRYYILHAYVDV